MKKFLLLAIVLCNLTYSFSLENIDELVEIFNSKNLSDRDKGRSIQDYVRGVHMQTELKFERLQKLIPVLKEHNQIEYYWNWYVCYSVVLRESGRNQEALSLTYMLLKEANNKNDFKWKSDAYFSLYDIHMAVGMKDKAKGFLAKAYDNSILSEEVFDITATSYLMGYTYYVEGKNDSAIIYLEQAKQYNLFLDQKLNRGEEYTYLLARVYIRNKEYQKAIELLHEVKNGSAEIENEYYSHYYHAGANMYLAQVQAIIGDLDSSDYYLNLAKNEYATFDQDQLALCYYYNGANYIVLKEYERAFPLISFLIDSAEFPLPLQLPARMYFGLGDCDKAINFYEDALHNQDSLNKQAINELTGLLDKSAKAELDIQKEIDIKKQEAAELVASSEKNQKNLILIGVLIFSILILIFGGILLKRYKIIKQQKDEINRQKLQVEEKNTEILDSINYAKRIQEAILPPQSSVKKYLPESFIFYKPKDVVAGDFYWMEVKENQIIIAAADCTGHGVPGAMVSVVCHNALNRSVREFRLEKPSDILNKTRELVIETFSKSETQVNDGMDISLCSISNRKLLYAGANNALWIFRKNKLIECKADKQPIGKFYLEKPFTNHEIPLELGDTLYLFTDGFQDQFGGENGKKYKASNLKKMLQSIQNESMEKQHVLLVEAFEQWKGKLEQLDDVCVIGVRI